LWRKHGKIVVAGGVRIMSQTTIFNTVPKSDVFKFFSRHNTVDGKRVVESLKFKKEDVSAATSIPLASVRYDEKMSALLERCLIEWATALNLVGNHFRDTNKALLWFQISNPQLGDYSPRDLIKLGRFSKLMRFIQTALEENSV